MELQMGIRMEFRDVLVKTHLGDKINEAQKKLHDPTKPHSKRRALLLGYILYCAPNTIYYILFYPNVH